MTNLKKTNNYNSIGTSQEFSTFVVPQLCTTIQVSTAKMCGFKPGTGFDNKPTLPVVVRSI